MGQPFSPGRPIVPARTPTEPRLTAWPRRAALSPAVLGARPRAVEALSLTPPPLPRVKFLLMDAGGSPQAETRWSDPITLHQGTLGRGCPGSSLSLTLGEMVVLSCPLHSPLPGVWVPGGSVQIRRTLHTDTGAGGWAPALSSPTCLPLLGALAPAQSWAAAAFPSNGSQPGPSIAG